jgi:hypothetical protein
MIDLDLDIKVLHISGSTKAFQGSFQTFCRMYIAAIN